MSSACTECQEDHTCQEIRLALAEQAHEIFEEIEGWLIESDGTLSSRDIKLEKWLKLKAKYVKKAV